MKFWLSVLIVGIVVLVGVYLVVGIAKLVHRCEDAGHNRKLKRGFRELGASDEEIDDIMEDIKEHERLLEEGRKVWPEQ